MGQDTPPGWPDEVPPPGAPDWERAGVAYLFDCCPPDFRGHAVFRRHPLVLAIFAEHCVRGQQRSAADGVASVRQDLGDCDPRVVAEAVEVWQAEAARLSRVARAVGLLRRAFAGERFVPRMAGSWR